MVFAFFKVFLFLATLGTSHSNVFAFANNDNFTGRLLKGPFKMILSPVTWSGRVGGRLLGRVHPQTAFKLLATFKFLSVESTMNTRKGMTTTTWVFSLDPYRGKITSAPVGESMQRGSSVDKISIIQMDTSLYGGRYESLFKSDQRVRTFREFRKPRV